jgi:hypothetical protein
MNRAWRLRRSLVRKVRSLFHGNDGPSGPATMFDVGPMAWADSHGAEANGHLGAGAIYFALPYMLKARTCVCLGSGAGFVPLLMLAAQRRLVSEGILCGTDVTLVDADIGIWGRPTYKTGKDIDPELKLVRQLTSVAAAQFTAIDFLHVDADHSYAGVKEDLECYFPRLSRQWAITVHDTDNPGAIRAGLPIDAWAAASDFSRERGISLIHFGVGCGTALLMPAR